MLSSAGLGMKQDAARFDEGLADMDRRLKPLEIGGVAKQERWHHQGRPDAGRVETTGGYSWRVARRHTERHHRCRRKSTILPIDYAKLDGVAPPSDYEHSDWYGSHQPQPGMLSQCSGRFVTTWILASGRGMSRLYKCSKQNVDTKSRLCRGKF